MKLTKREGKILLSKLPADAVKRISKSKRISTRMIHYILNGEQSDNHHVIEMAVSIAKVEALRQSKIKKELLSIETI